MIYSINESRPLFLNSLLYLNALRLHRFVTDILTAPSTFPANAFDRFVRLQLGIGNRIAQRGNAQHSSAVCHDS